MILRHGEKDPVRRWVPLLCAYSGARLSEVCQLRVEDVFQRGEVWCMKFDPEAESLKNENSERAVPLHPAIVKSGFLQFVAAARSGPPGGSVREPRRQRHKDYRTMGPRPRSDGPAALAKPLLATSIQDFGQAVQPCPRYRQRHHGAPSEDCGGQLRGVSD
jgi:integrase